MPAPSRPQTAIYDSIVACYRKLDREVGGIKGPHHQQIAKLLKQPHQVVVWAWEKGWPGAQGIPGMPAVRDLIFREQVLARAARNKTMQKLIEARTEELNNATEDSARSRALEGLAVRQQMMVAGELLNNTLQVLMGVQKMRESVIAGVNELANDPKTPMSKRLQIMDQLSEIAERDSKTLERAQALERRFMGEVEQRHRVDADTASAATAESVFDNLSALLRAMGVQQKPAAGALPAPAEPLLVTVEPLDEDAKKKG